MQHVQSTFRLTHGFEAISPLIISEQYVYLQNFILGSKSSRQLMYLTFQFLVLGIYHFFSTRAIFNRCLLTIKFSAAPAHIDIFNQDALPITYSVCCVLQNQLTNSTTHNTLLFLYQAKDSLSHRQWQTDSNLGLEADCNILRLLA